MDSRPRVTNNTHTAKNWRNVIEGLVDFAARRAFSACCVDCLPRYLYFAESSGDKFGDLITLAGHDPEPEGYALAHAEPVMTAGLTFENCRARIAKLAERLPLIATGAPASAKPVPVSHRSLWYND
jgi:hypothetical protein